MANIRTRETASGPRYDVKFTFNGKHRMKTFRTLDDARAYKKKMEGEQLAGLVVDPKGGERLFGRYADSWLEHRLVRGRPLTPATKQGYRAVLRRHVHPQLGGTKLRQITPERVRRWHAELSLVSPDQAAKSYRVLRAILNTAVSDGLITRNPCTIRGAGIEHAPERPMIATTTVLELAGSIEPRLRCLVLLGGFGGLRTGELLGLQRHDVDLLHGTMTVVRQSHEITGQGRIFTAPKSDAGYRTIALPSLVLTDLKEHLSTYVEIRPDAPLFTRPSGLPLRRADPSQAWKLACSAVGVSGIRPHDLRHHAATVIARNPNVTLRELMAAIGHSLAGCRPALPARHGRTEQGDRHLPRRRDRVGPECAGVRLNRSPSVRSRGIYAVSGKDTDRGEILGAITYLQKHSEATGGIEPPYGALQAPA
jgi:integrase